MGISARKTNGGYIGTDTRINVTGSVGVISQRKHRLSRLGGNLEPVVPSDVVFFDNFSSGDFSGAIGATWNTNASDEAGSLTRKWMVGQVTKNGEGDNVTIPSGSLYAAYVTDDGTDNHYRSSTDVFIYFDFTIPTGTKPSLTLTFDWMCQGENSSGNDRYDYGYILISTQEFEPEAGTKLSGLDNEDGWERITNTNISSFNSNVGKFNSEDSNSRSPTNVTPNAQTEWVSDNITLNDVKITSEGMWVAGAARRLIFGWTSDSSIQDQPSWTLANIKLE